MKTGVLIAAAVILIAGCKSEQAGHQVIQRGPAPTFQEVAAAYNNRVQPLSSLWAAVVLRLKYTDEEGQPHEDQVEGRLSFVSPRNVVLRLDKAGVTIGVLGSNDQKYWWIDLSEHKRALVGEHKRAAPEKLNDAGIPVHPLDLIELFGVTPLPTDGSLEGRKVAWSDDGRNLIVTVPGRSGARRLILNPDDFRPARIELTDAKGGVAASATLTKYEVVAMPGAGPEVEHGWIATDTRVTAFGGRTQGHFELSQPSVDRGHIKPAQFQLESWIGNKDVPVRQLDQPDPVK
jgi:hypothetical protein